MYLAAFWRILVGMHSGRPWRPGHRPGLDGLRGVAILLVVAAHVGLADRAGAVGVVVFFTLSGFLIATLLLEESEQTGRVGVGSFYARRARRLLPALLLMLAFVAAVDSALPAYSQADVQVGSLLYAANWVRLADHAHLDALGHTWSLAIEEQFYLVAPFLVIALRRRPRALAVGCAALAVASLSERTFFVLSGNTVRAHLGTDTQIDALLIGVSLAAALRGSGPRTDVQWRLLYGIGAAGLGVLVLADLGSRVFLTIGPTVVALATVALIYAALEHPAAFGSRPLVWVGRRSYGLYLWHYPLLKLAMRASGPWTAKAAIAVLVAVLISAASYRWVERPILRRFRGQPKTVHSPVRAVGVAVKAMSPET